MTGLFSGILDDPNAIGEAEDISFGIPEGVYEGIVSAASVERRGEKDSLFLILEYSVTEGRYKGRSQSEFKRLPEGPMSGWDDKDFQALSFVKARLSDLGVPPEKMGSLEADEIVGTEVVFTVKPSKRDKDYMNITRVELATGQTVGPLPTAAPAATAAVAKSDNPYG